MRHVFIGVKRILGLCLVVWLLMPATAHARLIDGFSVKRQAEGYEINISFILSLRYQSHTPQEKGKIFHVQLRPTNYKSLTADEVSLLRDRVTLGLEHESGIPLQEITFEGGDPERPEMTFIFTEDVDVAFRSGDDLRSLIVTVKPEYPREAVPSEVPFAQEFPKDERLASLMKEANDSMIQEEYHRAVQLYTKILETAEGSDRQQAQELLGLARERNGQLAHAKAEYEKYLEEFPQGPDAERVRQRLAGLITASKAPRERLKGAAPRQEARVKPIWVSRYYGDLSQFFFRDQTIPEGGEAQLNRNDITTDLDLNSRWQNDAFDLRGKITTSYQNNFVEGQGDSDRISALSFEGKAKKYGVSGKVGRQSRTSGGVLGRFDGAHVAYEVSPMVTLNSVFGFPVDSTNNTYVEYARRFYGVSADFGTYKDAWDFSGFFITQDNKGLTDRSAIGSEVRYFDPKKGFFNLIDYDVFYQTLNIFLFNGHWSVLEKTTFNFVYDFRRSPLLTTNNAIQGQGVNKIAQLFDRFSSDDLYSLAKDRTAVSKTTTFGVTQDLKKDMQLIGEMTISEIEETVSSGGVEEVPGTGKEYFYSTQLVTNNVFIDNDVVITGLRLSDVQTSNTLSFNVNSRFPYREKIRFIPKFRMDYRQDKGDDDNRLTVRPVVGVDYRFKEWMRLEMEGGFEWINEKASGIPQQSTELFISAGYRLSF